MYRLTSSDPMADRCTLKCQTCAQKCRPNRELRRHLLFNCCSAPSPLSGLYPIAVKTALALHDADHSPFNVDKFPPCSISVDIGGSGVEESTCASDQTLDNVSSPSSNDEQPRCDVIRPTVVDTAVQTAVCRILLPPDFDLSRPVRTRS